MAEVNRELTPEELKAFGRMLQTIRTKRDRNRLKSDYNEAKKRLDKIGFSIPPHMIDFESALGWPNKCVVVPARRWRPEGYTLTKPSTLLDTIHETTANENIVALEKNAAESSMELSVSFIFVTPGDLSKGEPRVVVAARTALEATCEVNPRTFRTELALEVLSRQKFLMYVPGKTLQIELGKNQYRVTAEYNGIGNLVMCTPYVWGRTLSRPFGRSRITRPIMGFTDQGIRTMLRGETHAEFFSGPQRALLGADDSHFRDANGKRISPLQAMLGSLWALPDTRDEETGDLVRPKLEQMMQSSPQPHAEMMRGIAMQVSSESSIPVTYLGIIQDNPSSADAIRANESDLIAVVQDQLPHYGAARTDLARNVAAVAEGEWTEAMERDLRGLQAKFGDPGTATTAERADAGLKYVQTFPDGDPEVAMERYGLTRQEIERNLRHMKKVQAERRMQEMLAGLPSPQQVEPSGRGPAIAGQVVEG